MKHFKAVIFDMDGLLLDSERIALSAFCDTCTQFGLPEAREVFIRCIGTNAALGRDVLKEGLPAAIDHLLFEAQWERNYLERTTNDPIPVKEGAEQLLDHIASLHIPAAVATSTRTDRAHGKLQRAAILHHFRTIIGGDQVAASKPAPDIYLRAAEVLNVCPESCLALEDSENGVRAALSARMTVVQVPDLVPPSDAFRALGHIVLPRLSDVMTFPFAAGMHESDGAGGHPTEALDQT